jgi:peptidoglycan pentaglycine glycine transferase (the first glycine)
MAMRVLTPADAGFPSPAAWDAFVASRPQGHLLQSWSWGELKGQFGWRPLRLAVLEREEIRATAQVLLRPLPYRCLAYVPRGPVLDLADEATANLLLPALHQAARREGAIALKIEPPQRDDPQGAPWWAGHGFHATRQTVQPRRTVLLDLQPDEEAILAQMKPKWRYNVRLAERKALTVRQGGVEDLPAFHALMGETGARDGFAAHTPAYYQAAMQLFQPGGAATLLLAEFQGQPIAGLMAFAFGCEAIYMYGASSDQERARMPNHLLQWEAMRWAKAKGCTRYDLWGIADTDPNSPSAGLSGVERFKVGFGGETVRFLGAFDYVYDPLVNWAFNRLWAWRRRRARKAGPEAAGADS